MVQLNFLITRSFESSELSVWISGVDEPCFDTSRTAQHSNEAVGEHSVFYHQLTHEHTLHSSQAYK